MQITINVPDYIINQIKNTYNAMNHKDITDAKLVRFLQNDIIQVYADHVDQGLEDALDMIR